MSAPGRAQTTDACAQFTWSIDRERSAFAVGTIATIKSGDAYPALLEGVHVTLGPQAGVSYPVPPARAPKQAPAYGAVLTAPPIAQAALYQVTLSDEGWIDLVQGGKRLRSSGFSGKEGCPGVRKTVRFALEAGPVTIEISDAGKPTLDMDLLPAQ